MLVAELTLVDTSAWIEFFRDRAPLATEVDSLLAAESAATCGVVELELVAGLRRGEDYVFEHLSAVTRLLTLEEDFLQAGFRLRALRARGVTVPATDALIYQVAARHDAKVLAKDKHFTQLGLEDSEIS